MNRKEEYIADLDHYDNSMGIHSSSYQKCVERLNKLADLDGLEEELGCSLKIVFKALKNGIYVYNGNHFVVFLKYYKIHNKFRLKDVNGLLYSLEDYKKDWLLKEDKSE